MKLTPNKNMIYSLRFCTTIFLCCALFFLSGCSKKPTDFPKVVPFNIKLVKGSEVIDGAVLGFSLADGEKGAWSIGGVTDASGLAELETSLAEYSEKGIPPGKYKISVMKQPSVPGELSNEELGKLDMAEGMKYSAKIRALRDKAPRIVPDDWVYFNKTPVLLEIPESGGEATINVAEYMK